MERSGIQPVGYARRTLQMWAALGPHSGPYGKAAIPRVRCADQRPWARRVRRQAILACHRQGWKP
jgi:hypothetical protein